MLKNTGIYIPFTAVDENIIKPLRTVKKMNLKAAKEKSEEL